MPPASTFSRPPFSTVVPLAIPSTFSTPPLDSIVPRVRDVAQYWRTILRSGAIGTFIGAMPGLGEDIAAYDAFYKRLIAAAPLQDVSSSFAMEQIKFTTALPI